MNPIDSFGPGAAGPPEAGARWAWARMVSTPVGRHAPPATSLLDRLCWGLLVEGLLLVAMAVLGLAGALRGGG